MKNAVTINLGALIASILASAVLAGGGTIWAVSIAQAEQRGEMKTLTSRVTGVESDSQDFTNYLRTIDSRLSRIEGALGVKTP